jgi:HK97 gp10 family phage protein
VPVPKSVIKLNKNGVQYKSNVDRIKYTLEELERAALRDTAKLIRKKMIAELKKLPGMKRNRRIYSSSQYWVRKRETDLQVGFKHDTWYGVLQELGSKNQPRRDILRNSTFNNIDDIRRIQGAYLSALNDENRALGLISEEEYKSLEGEEG